MASAFTASVVTPPAPKKSAWTARTSASQTNATRGLKTSARSATPPRWVEVPPGTGTRIVWTTNASAVSEPITGSASTAFAPKWRRAAQAKSGAATAYAGTVTTGERKPSGTCTASPPRAAAPERHDEQADEDEPDDREASDDAVHPAHLLGPLGRGLARDRRDRDGGGPRRGRGTGAALRWRRGGLASDRGRSGGRLRDRLRRDVDLLHLPVAG